jgi:hypothetical protein
MYEILIDWPVEGMQDKAKAMKGDLQWSSLQGMIH